MRLRNLGLTAGLGVSDQRNPSELVAQETEGWTKLIYNIVKSIQRGNFIQLTRCRSLEEIACQSHSDLFRLWSCLSPPSERAGIGCWGGSLPCPPADPPECLSDWPWGLGPLVCQSKVPAVRAALLWLTPAAWPRLKGRLHWPLVPRSSRLHSHSAEGSISMSVDVQLFFCCCPDHMLQWKQRAASAAFCSVANI